MHTRIGCLIVLQLLIPTTAMFCMPAPESTVVVREEQNHQTIRLRPKQHLAISLPAQFGTGYSWRLAGERPSILSPEPNPAPPAGRDVRPGGVEVQEFLFAAVTSGTATLTYVYSQPWDKEARPSKTFSIKIVVADDGASNHARDHQAWSNLE